ncbi:MAG: response regulator [Selenomonadaceae bacterium]|nr:response regulator [Selenomonadaceae bacterium]MDY3915828.1 response regulator [Selenomonadaceae bacterium]
MDTQLEITSVYGQGSTFAFEVTQQVIKADPLGDFAQQVRQLAHPAADMGLLRAPTASVLVVDDVEMNIKVFRGLLKRTQIQVDSALSGAICLEMIQKKSYDMIFLDHRMPEMDGIETFQHMRQMDHLCKGKPIIALTANAISGARQEYLDAGFTDYLTKPIDSHKLEAMLKQYLPPEKVEDVQPEDVADPEPAAGTALPAWLQAQKTLDTASGITNCGSPEDYLETLQLFAAAYTENKSAIQNFFDTRDWKNYTIRVHALKSSARIIGAGELSELAAALEQAGNANDTAKIQADTPKLFQLYAACEDVLQPLAPAKTDAAAVKEPLSMADLQEAYAALKELATTFDYDSVQFVLEDLQDKEPPAEEREHYEAVCQAARKPDWLALKKLLP